MPHPSTKPEILAALESNAATIVPYFSGLPERAAFDGDSDRWSAAHHLLHLTRSSAAVSRAMRSGKLPAHSTARSRAYAEVRDGAAASVGDTSKDRLLEMGRAVVIAPDAKLADLSRDFAAASAELRAAAAEWTEEALDRSAIQHPMMGELTVREMLLFTVLHERHHLRSVQTRLASPNPSSEAGRTS